MNYEKLPKTISAEELLSTPLPPVKWIIPGLLPAGLALFAGPSKAGKSWLTLWLCLQIAQGNPVWDREIEPRTVIYFSLEDTFNRLQNRIFQLIDGGDAPERLILQTECPSIGQGLEEQVESLIHTYRDVGLIVIDTLQKVRVSDGNGGMYANDYKEAGALKKLADKYGICILLIHHLRKQSAADPFDQISGSTGLMGVADTSWVMQRKRMSQTADILLTGRDMDDRTLHLREENCVWTLEDEETAEEREIKAVPDYLWKAAEYIESVGNWQGTASELLAAAGIENAKPNQFTYNMAKYFDKVFEPKNIRYLRPCIRQEQAQSARKTWKGDWIMTRKIKLTRANKSILLKALGDHYYLQRAMNTGWRETGYLILKVDSLLVGKKAVFTSEEVCLARNAVNQLRNKKIKQGQYTDATDDMLLKLF